MKQKSYLQSIIFFGALLCLLLAMLHYLEYKFFIGALDKDIYTTVIATIFTAAGIWLGLSLFGNKKQVEVIEVLATTDTGKNAIDDSLLTALKLNQREYEVLRLLTQGKSNKEISEILFIALPTVKTHASKLYSKLNVKSRTQAIHFARENRLI